MAATDGGDGGNVGGVLGNLPRSRPGQRSQKRAGSVAGTGGRVPAAASTVAAPGVPQEVGRGEGPPPAGVAPASGGTLEGGTLEGAVRLAARAARLGLDAAGGVLKRLPRP